MVKRLAQINFPETPPPPQEQVGNAPEEEVEDDDDVARIVKSNSFAAPGADLYKKKARQMHLRRRCFSCPQVLEERRLQMRRSICESAVQKLYDDRKENIEELFQNQWFLSDVLEDMD